MPEKVDLPRKENLREVIKTDYTNFFHILSLKGMRLAQQRGSYIYKYSLIGKIKAKNRGERFSPRFSPISKP